MLALLLDACVPKLCVGLLGGAHALLYACFLGGALAHFELSLQPVRVLFPAVWRPRYMQRAALAHTDINHASFPPLLHS